VVSSSRLPRARFTSCNWVWLIGQKGTEARRGSAVSQRRTSHRTISPPPIDHHGWSDSSTCVRPAVHPSRCWRKRGVIFLDCSCFWRPVAIRTSLLDLQLVAMCYKRLSKSCVACGRLADSRADWPLWPCPGHSSLPADTLTRERLHSVLVGLDPTFGYRKLVCTRAGLTFPTTSLGTICRRDQAHSSRLETGPTIRSMYTVMLSIPFNADMPLA
jgi:hypothetical protein